MHSRELSASLRVLLAIAMLADLLTACTQASSPTAEPQGQPVSAASLVPETATAKAPAASAPTASASASPIATPTRALAAPTATPAAPIDAPVVAPSPTLASAWELPAGILTDAKQETVSPDTVDKTVPVDILANMIVPELDYDPMTWNCSLFSEKSPVPVIEQNALPARIRQMDAPLMTFCGWKAKEQVKVTIRYPDGRENSKTFTAKKDFSTDFSAYVQFGYQISPDDPLGDYTVIAEGASGRVEKSFKVTAASLSKPQVLPVYADPFRPSYRPWYQVSSEKRVLLSGFAPGERVQLLLYDIHGIVIEGASASFSFLGSQQVVTGPDGKLVVRNTFAVSGPWPVYWIAVGETTGPVIQPYYGDQGVLQPAPKMTVQCPVIRPSRLWGASYFRAAYSNGAQLRVRRQPGFNQKIATTVPEGTELSPEGNPACADQTWWWPVSVNGFKGYVAEADPQEYLLEPLAQSVSLSTATSVAAATDVAVATPSAEPAAAAGASSGGVLASAKQVTITNNSIDTVLPPDVLPKFHLTPWFFGDVCGKRTGGYTTPQYETGNQLEKGKQMDAPLLLSCGWNHSDEVKVTVVYPDGRKNSKAFQPQDTPGYPGSEVHFVNTAYQITLDDPPGLYTFIAESGNWRIEEKLNVAKDADPTPRVLAVYDDPFNVNYQLFNPDRVLLSGFAGNETVRLLLYGGNSNFYYHFIGSQQVVTGPDGALVIQSTVADANYWVAIGEQSGAAMESIYTDQGVLDSRPRFTAQCPVIKPTRLEDSTYAIVVGTGGLNVRIRKGPGSDQPILTEVKEGARLYMAKAPQCADQTWWWLTYIDTTTTSIIGWVAEADPNEYILEPAP